MANLGNPTNTIAVLQKYDFMFQKKFGQNFLIDERVLEKIIRAAGASAEVAHSLGINIACSIGICLSTP